MSNDIDRSDWVQRSGNKSVDDPTERLYGRLRKILELTNSPNEQESASAASKLQELLTEHNLSMADLEARGQKAPPMREQPHDLGKAAFKWKLGLAEGIAEFYYCAPLVDRRTKAVAFVGRPENVEALTMLYVWVIDQIKDIAREERRTNNAATGIHIDPLRWQIGFGEGAVERLIERLRDMKAKHEADISRNDQGDVTALVIHRQAEVSDYLEAKFGYRLDGKMTKQERESEERWQKYMAEVEAKRKAKGYRLSECEMNDDMDTYYAEYPEEHPDKVAERAAADAKAYSESKKRRYRPSRSTGLSRERRVDYNKNEQSTVARNSGRAAAGKVNLQPFLTGDNAKRKKVG